MKTGDICGVHVALTGAWPAWYLARIVRVDTHANGTAIEAIQVAGQANAIESWLYVATIEDLTKQAAAARLYVWPQSWSSANALKQAIVNESWKGTAK